MMTEPGKQIESNVDFILSHFLNDPYPEMNITTIHEDKIFPRRMMTLRSNGQFTVTSKSEIIENCRRSNFTDCRISGYPDFIEFDGILLYPPDFLFIDLDLKDFIAYKYPHKLLNLYLYNTLHNIANVDKRVNMIPSVLWSGNGYHIYVPLSGSILDRETLFSKCKFPSLFSSPRNKYFGKFVSELFLKYLTALLSDGKSDPQHNISYKSCLTRIPNTYNSKCLRKGFGNENSRVKIIQRWNGKRLPIQLFTKGFARWLLQEEINEFTSQGNRNQISMIYQHITYDNSQKIKWIEKLLLTAVPDGRKEILRLILGPYLARTYNGRDCTTILLNWLEKCNSVAPLDKGYDYKGRVKNVLRNTKGYQSLESLRIKNQVLYDIIKSSLK